MLMMSFCDFLSLVLRRQNLPQEHLIGHIYCPIFTKLGQTILPNYISAEFSIGSHGVKRRLLCKINEQLCEHLRPHVLPKFVNTIEVTILAQSLWNLVTAFVWTVSRWSQKLSHDVSRTCSKGQLAKTTPLNTQDIRCLVQFS